MRWCIALLLSAGLAACSMLGSSPIDRMSAIGCSSDGGAYYLSRTYFEIEVDQWGAFAALADGTAPDPLTTKPVSTWHELKEVKANRKPDREQGYCLDYLSSPTSDEKVWVRKDKDYLLTLISTQSIDQSAYIAQAIIRTLFVGLASGGARALTAQKLYRFKIGVAFKGEYDPFDQAQSAVINDALKELGLCLILENETFDSRGLTVDAYCSDPRRALTQQGGPSKKTKPPRHDASDTGFRGIAYRPRVPYNYYLFAREARKGQVEWKLRQSEAIALENRSPIINVGVDRSFFANRRTSLIFDQGALKNICIYKSSEFAEAATIPLAIAKNIAALPANVIQLRIDNTNNFQKLAQAEDALILQQQKHLEFLSGTGTGAQAPSGTRVTTEQPKFSFAPIGTIKKETDANAFPTNWTAICPKDAFDTANAPVYTPPVNPPAVIGSQPIGPTP